MPEAPESDTPSRTKNKPVSRREALKKELKMAETDELEMPPCDAPHMVGYLFEVGPTAAAGMGDGPVTHSEIAAFQGNTGIEFDAWEARTLRRMSQSYASEASQATARDRPAPWANATYAKSVPNLQAEKVRDSIRALANL